MLKMLDVSNLPLKLYVGDILVTIPIRMLSKLCIKEKMQTAIAAADTDLLDKW